MKRGTLVGVVLMCLALSAGAEEPARVRTSSPPQVTLTKDAALRELRQTGPATFEITVPSKEGRGMNLYRYDRAKRTAVRLSHLNGAGDEIKPKNSSPVNEHPGALQAPEAPMLQKQNLAADCDDCTPVQDPSKVVVINLGIPNGMPGDWYALFSKPEFQSDLALALKVTFKAEMGTRALINERFDASPQTGK